MVVFLKVVFFRVAKIVDFRNKRQRAFAFFSCGAAAVLFDSEDYVGGVGIVVGEVAAVAQRGVDDGALLDLDFWCDEDEVYLVGVGGGYLAKVVEGVGRTFGRRGAGPRVLHGEDAGGELGVDGVALVYVEVAGEDHGQFAGHAADALLDEHGAVLSRFVADVVEVGVDRHDVLEGLLVAQDGPGGNAAARRAPARGGRLGSLRQPEGAAVDEFELLLIIIYRAVFAALLAVVARHPHVGVGGQCPADVVELQLLHLLHADDVGLALAQELAHLQEAHLPVVLAVALVLEPYVEGHDAGLDGLLALRRGGQGGEGEQQGGQYGEVSFHHCVAISFLVWRAAAGGRSR
jgi:hypothetical protein